MTDTWVKSGFVESWLGGVFATTMDRYALAGLPVRVEQFLFPGASPPPPLRDL